MDTFDDSFKIITDASTNNKRRGDHRDGVCNRLGKVYFYQSRKRTQSWNCEYEHGSELGQELN